MQKVGVFEATAGIEQHNPFMGLDPFLATEDLQCGKRGRTLGASKDAFGGGEQTLGLRHLLIRYGDCGALAVTQQLAVSESQRTLLARVYQTPWCGHSAMEGLQWHPPRKL